MSLSGCYGHVEHMAHDRLFKNIKSTVAEGSRRQSRPQKRWMDAMKDLMRARDIFDEDAIHMLWDQVQWKHFECEAGLTGNWSHVTTQSNVQSEKEYETQLILEWGSMFLFKKLDIG